MQVQEGALDWLLSVLSATVMHIGPQLLPYKQRLKALLDAFFALPSKVSPHQASLSVWQLLVLDLATLHNSRQKQLLPPRLAARQVLRGQCTASELQASLAHTMSFSAPASPTSAVLGGSRSLCFAWRSCTGGPTSVLCCCCGHRCAWTCASWTSCAATGSSSLLGCCSPCAQHWSTTERLACRTCTCAPLGCWDPSCQRWSPGTPWTNLRPWRRRKQQALQMAVLQLCTWSRGS